MTACRAKGNRWSKDFRALDLGQIALPAEHGTLSLRALEVPGRSVVDLRGVTLELLVE